MRSRSPRAAWRRAPQAVEEFPRRARVGAARVPIANLCGEEFDAEIRRRRAGDGDEGEGRSATTPVNRAGL